MKKKITKMNPVGESVQQVDLRYLAPPPVVDVDVVVVDVDVVVVDVAVVVVDVDVAVVDVAGSLHNCWRVVEVEVV